MPRLNLLAWLGVVGVAGVVMIGSSAILHSGTNALYKVEESAEDGDKIPAALENELEAARRALSAGEPMRAITQLQLALERYPKHEKAITPLLANGYDSRGEALKRERKYEDAAKEFEKAVGLAPSDPSFRVAQGHVLYLAGREAQDHKESSKAKAFYKNAMAAYEKALAIEPHHAEATLGQARIYAARDERKQAVACFKDVAENHPDTPEAEEAHRMLRTLTGNR